MDFWILFWVFLFLLVVIEIPMFVGGFSAAPWLPTSHTDLPRINKLAGLKPGQVFFDIGCGDGRICNYIADKNPGVKVFGYEIAYPLYLLCWLKAMRRGNTAGAATVSSPSGRKLKHALRRRRARNRARVSLSG